VAVIPSSYLICFLISLASSLLLTRWVRNFATAHGLVGTPGQNGQCDSKPVPRLGGVAICISFMGLAVASLLFPKWTGSPLTVGMALSIFVPALIVFGLGLYDDLRSVDPYWKFGVQTIAAILLYWGGYGIQELHLLRSEYYLRPAISLPLTILWVLVITNAFNLIDGLDGLAAGSALFSTGMVFIVSLLNPNPTLTFLTIVLAGAILGFLRFNFHPATIFLGDSGSLFIGFMLSVLALVGSQKAPTMIAVAIPVVALGLPILDVVLAVIRRFLAGKPLFSRDNDHIHHKLLKMGFSQREAVLILYAVTAGFGFMSLALLQGRQAIALVLASIGIGVWIGIQQLHYVEFTVIQDLFTGTRQRKRVIANNLSIRRATESLRSCKDFRALFTILEDTMQPVGFDGFRFKNSSVGSLPEPLLAPLRTAPDGEYSCSWTDFEGSEPAWEIRLQLVTSTGYHWGHFSLFRTHPEKPLFVDLNLLNSAFRTNLFEALQCAMNRAQLAASSLEVEKPGKTANSASA
jgi:UDP-GlcNAc:undecaprenyl-phosphate GlcNAc-1-phosphate transferase